MFDHEDGCDKVNYQGGTCTCDLIQRDIRDAQDAREAAAEAAAEAALDDYTKGGDF